MDAASTFNFMVDVLDSFSHCKSADEIWQKGLTIFDECASGWVSVGTAPSSCLHAIHIRSNTPQSLMRDYMEQKVHLEDPWMQHCANSAQIDELLVADGLRALDAQVGSRQCRLFDSYNIVSARLFPSYAGSRSGGIVLYSRDKASDLWQSSAEGKVRTRLATSLFAANYRPDGPQLQLGELYRTGALLTLRERETLQWLASGLQNANIAAKMNIESVTVSKHLASARRKLNAKTREHAIAIAIRDQHISI